MDKRTRFYNLTGWLFGGIVFLIGLINAGWGNDPVFGMAILVCSFIYFPPVNKLLKRRLGFSVPLIVKIVLGILIIWAAVGVGELFDKMNLLRNDLFS